MRARLFALALLLTPLWAVVQLKPPAGSRWATTAPITTSVSSVAQLDAAAAVFNGRVVRYPSTINVAAGTYSRGALFENIRFGTASTTNGSYLEIVGTLANIQPATGTATGTATAGSSSTLT